MGTGNSLPYVQPLHASHLLARSPVASVFTLQKQAYGTSATLPTAPSVYPTRVNTDGRSNYWTLATILQVSFRCPCTIPSDSAQTPTPYHSGCHGDRRPFDITNYISHPRATVTTTRALSNTITAGSPTAYTASITSSTCASRRYAKRGSNKDGPPRADRRREIDERRHEEETEEGKRPHAIRDRRRWRGSWRRE